MVVVVTVDENGGWWDPVAPPPGDRWGPGTRIPAIIVSPYARKGYVDHTYYDTTSIIKFITKRYALEPLPGVRQRARSWGHALRTAPDRGRLRALATPVQRPSDFSMHSQATPGPITSDRP